MFITRGNRVDRGRILATASLSLLTFVLALPNAVPSQAQAVKGESSREEDPLVVPPFDRITLTDGTVLRAEPVLPRPLPPYDAKLEEKKRVARRQIPVEGNISLPNAKAKPKPEPSDDDDEGNPGIVMIHLLDGDVRDFRLKRPNLKAIDYYEDILLAEAERLILARDFTRAFECLLRVRERNPSWRGLDATVNHCLFAEGTLALLDSDGDRGLRLLGELSARKPDYPGLADKLATSYGARANRAFELGLYARGRKILHEVEPMAPGHAYVREIREKFVKRAQELTLAAGKTENPARLDKLTDALRVWPTLEKGDAAYRESFLSEPTLDVAVNDVPRGAGPWVRSPADARVTRLLYLPVLARDDQEAMQGKDPFQLAVSATTIDLGRRILIQLRSDVTWYDGSRPVGSIDVARALTDAAEPTSPRFSARWADLLDRVESPDAAHVEVRLTRVSLKPASWFLGPVGPAHVAVDGRITSLDRGRELVSDAAYRWAGSSPDRVELRLLDPSATISGNDSPPRPKIRRIKEVRYPNARQTIGGFIRGEVSLVEHVPSDRVAELAANPSFKVGRYARPRLHVLALDGRSPALRNRNLRRGLSYGVDRRALLEDTLLRRPADDVNVVSDGPFPRADTANSPGVAPLIHDTGLARMLVAGARKELGGQPLSLKLEYPAIAEAQAAAPKLIEAFRALGLEIVGVERPESELEAELRAGRRFDLAYRALRCEQPVVDVGPLLAPAYDAPPTTNPLASMASPRILQLLMQLERASDWPTARELVVQIDRECRDELPIIPLWELEDHYAWHTRLTGPKDVADQLYEGIASWEISPWFARDPW